MSKKLLAVSFVATVAFVACTAEGPTTPPRTETIQRAEEPVVSATPAPTPVVAPNPSTPSFELTGAKPSTIYVKYTGEASFVVITTFYTSFDDQTTPFGKQSHTVKSGDTVTRVFDGTCIQGDADQEGVKEIGGVFFDINGAPFNPTRNPEKVTKCRNQCVPTWGEWADYFGESQAETVQSQCSKRQRRIKSCTGEEEFRTVEVNPSASLTLGSLTFPTYTPKKPAVVVTGDAARSAWCVAKGGTWLNDYNIPSDDNKCETDDNNYSGDSCPNVCRTTNSNPNSIPGVDNDDQYEENTEDYRYWDLSGNNSYETSPEVPASGGNPISGSASISNAGSFKLILRAKNGGNYEKNVDTETLTCGQTATLNVSYNWIGHDSEDWTLEGYINNVLVATSAIVKNPSN